MQILIGCIVGVFSSALQSLGLTLQRKAHLNEAAGGHHTAILWRTGVAMFILANVFGSSVQLVALPLIVLCPLQAIGLVFNSALAALILDEPFTRLSGFGTLLVTIGAVLIAGLGAVADPQLSLDKLIEQFQQPGFLLWAAFTMVVVFGLLLAIHFPKKQCNGRLAGVYLGGVAGIFSAHSLLMAKSAVDLLVHAFKHGISDLLRPAFWIIVGLFLAFAVGQLYFANAGLRHASTQLFYPLVFCVYNVVSMINGFVYYDDSSRMTWAKVGWVSSGTVVLLVGVLLLSLPQQDEEDKDTFDAYTMRARDRYVTSRTPLLDTGYTSLDSLDPTIASPDGPRSPHNKGKRKPGQRKLSKEQSQILSELGQAPTTQL